MVLPRKTKDDCPYVTRKVAGDEDFCELNDKVCLQVSGSGCDTYKEWLKVELPPVKDYVTYRVTTGKCETCGSLMNEHPKCEACGILCGHGHLDAICHYREHEICGHCLIAWKLRERVTDSEVTWKKFCGSVSIKKN